MSAVPVTASSTRTRCGLHCLERRIVDPPPPDVEKIPTLSAGQDPGGANRPVIFRSSFAGGVPTLQRYQSLGVRRQLVAVAPDPMALDHRPAGWGWRLLILGGEGITADLKLQGLQNMERLALGRGPRQIADDADRPFPSGTVSSNSAIAGRLGNSRSAALCGEITLSGQKPTRARRTIC
jgi:hypothetical protein